MGGLTSIHGLGRLPKRHRDPGSKNVAGNFEGVIHALNFKTFRKFVNPAGEKHMDNHAVR